jgi:steroid delta-isomerase-like uncharacterized protein
MSIEANRGMARRFFTEVANGGNLEVAKDLLVADYRHHDPGLPPELLSSRDAYIGHFPVYTTAFPDLSTTVEDMIAEGDKVVTRWTIRGTHNGELMGIPPTGTPIAASGITIQRFADGKIVEGWTIFDTLGILRQLGVVPSLGA